MKATQRRKDIVNLLIMENGPISGRRLSEKLGVSRQIIVQDIDSLKKDGYTIISTHYGYVMQNTSETERVFKVRHTTNETENELNTIVDLGGSVVDVFVWHKAYGKMSAKLNISSRLHVKNFIESVRSGKSIELMNITGGYHYHTVRAESRKILDLIEISLAKYIVPEKNNENYCD